MNFFFSDFLKWTCRCLKILEISIDEVFLFRVQADGFLHVFYRAFLVSFQQSGSSPFLIESGIFRHQFNGFCIVLDGSIQLFQFDVKLSFQQVGIFVEGIVFQYLVESLEGGILVSQSSLDFTFQQ